MLAFPIQTSMRPEEAREQGQRAMASAPSLAMVMKIAVRERSSRAGSTRSESTKI